MSSQLLLFLTDSILGWKLSETWGLMLPCTLRGLLLPFSQTETSSPGPGREETWRLCLLLPQTPNHARVQLYLSLLRYLRVAATKSGGDLNTACASPVSGRQHRARRPQVCTFTTYMPVCALHSRRKQGLFLPFSCSLYVFLSKPLLSVWWLKYDCFHCLSLTKKIINIYDLYLAMFK